MYQYTDSQLPDLLEMECSDMELKNRTLSNFAELVRTGECKKFRGRLKVGVDLGTANTVLAVVDSTNWKKSWARSFSMPLLPFLREFQKAV